MNRPPATVEELEVGVGTDGCGANVALVDDSVESGMVQCFRLATMVRNGEDKLSKYA